MRLKLQGKWISYLTNQPESGMGYQVVDVRLKDGRVVEKVFVFNCEDIQLPDDFAKVGIVELKLHRD